MRSSSAHQLRPESIAPPSEDVLRLPLTRLKLPPRFVQSLRKLGVHRIDELLRCSRRELLCLRGVGPLTLWQAQETMKALGVTLPVEVRHP